MEAQSTAGTSSTSPRTSARKPSLFDGAAGIARSRARWSVHAGIDEAGLGPMLGPLTLGVSALRFEEPVEDTRGVHRALREHVTSDPSDDAERLVVADSKVVYTRNPRGARRLEHTALAFLAQRDASGAVPRTTRELVRSFPAEIGACDGLERECWAAGLDAPLPRDADAAELDARCSTLRAALAKRGIALAAAAVRVVPVAEFNRSIAATDNKARTHWLETRPLLEHLWNAHAEHGLSVVVDRQGGRMRYRPLLEEAFPRAVVRTRVETSEVSEYACEEPATARAPERRMLVSFRVKAESEAFTVALASCLAKYVRELCMHAFNAHFGALDPTLKPTAGYLNDGRRWLAEARTALERGNVELSSLVRRR